MVFILVHGCTKIKKLYNKYLIPYWQDKIHKDEIWKKLKNIPDEKLWKVA